MSVGSFDLTKRTCKVCGAVYRTPYDAGACSELELPRTFPSFKKGDSLAISVETFARDYPHIPAEENRFKLVGPLQDAMFKRTGMCEVVFDGQRQTHRYRIHLRWIGMPTEIHANRKLWVWADEVTAFLAGEGK